MIFLQKFPANLDVDKIKYDLMALEVIREIHAIRGWSVDDEIFCLSLQIKVSSETQIEQLDALTKKIKSILLTYNVKFSALEYESI